MTRPEHTVLPGGDRWGPASAVWDTDEWRWEATRWIDAALERRGVQRVPTSPRQPRIRPWSTQLVVETDQGRAWFKAGVPEQSPEVAVLDLLRGVAPDLLPPTWADDGSRGWSLQPDQGRLLREVATADTIVPAWSTILRMYARLQRASTAVIDDLVEAGVPRLRPDDLVRGWVARGHPHERAADARLHDAADRLEAVGLPLTVQHDDLHAGNVFCADDGEQALQGARIFDWGDVYVGHPLCSLLISLRDPIYHFGLPADPDRDERLTRAYLAGWSDLATPTTLSSLVPEALLLARVGRLLGWERALARADERERAQWQPHTEQWAAEIMEVAAPDART